MHLVTGTSSGLGKFLQIALKAVPFVRGDQPAPIKSVMQIPFDAIIHCAYNQRRDLSSHHLQQYMNDNLFFIQQLLEIPHKKFIFISSADIYPREEKSWQEEDEFPVEKITGLYGLSKLMAEAIVKTNAKNYLILRPTALLGIHSRPNSLIRILNESECKLTLHQQSSFNYILHHDVLAFIEEALAHDLCGVFNLAASTSVLLEDIAFTFKRNIHFGSYVYQVANLCNKKVVQHCHVFSHSSLDNIRRYLTLKEDSYVKGY